MAQALEAAPLFGKIGAVVRARAERAGDEAAETHLVVALDSSASMRQCFDSVKQTLCKFYNKTAEVKAVASSRLYGFSSRTVEYQLNNGAPRQTCQLISGLSTGSGTTFRSALTAIQQQVSTGPPKACYFVVFFTGGSR